MVCLFSNVPTKIEGKDRSRKTEDGRRKTGEMEYWKDGKMERWKDGEME
jgi:hypothetical protein